MSDKVDKAKRNTRGTAWLLTWNNYSDHEFHKIIADNCSQWAYQIEEAPTTGKLHLQGAIYFKNSRWYDSLTKIFRGAHIERARKWHAIKNYCQKNPSRVEGPWINLLSKDELPPVPDPLEGIKLYKWQTEMISLLESDRDDRSIFWVFDKTGNMGKTVFCKSLCINNSNYLYLSGKAKDMKYAVSCFMKEKKEYPWAVLFDFPRSSDGFISYQGIEEIKNGIFFSSKYESTQCIFPNPHVICFANFYPDKEMLSKDRWQIINLNEGEPAATAPDVETI